MLLNDVSRCQGTITEYIDADTRTVSTAMHPQCIDCRRRTEIECDVSCYWIDAPLGLLADPDKLCDMRIGS
jgi:hypothetical protein